MRRSARIPLLVAALLAGGCSDSTGPELFGCDAARYNIGETVNGSLRTSDCRGPDGEGRIDVYQFRQSSRGPVSIVFEAPEGSVPMIVGIAQSDDEPIDFDEVDGGGEAVVGGILDPGTYFIAVAAEFPGAQSTYSFTSERTVRFSGPPFLNCTTVTTYTLGATVNGTLGTGDCVTPEGPYLDRYQLTLTTARTVTITQTSNDIDSYLYLFDSQGVIIAENDDSGASFDSRISMSLPAGTYSIGASAYDQFESGSYTLRAQ